MKSREFIRGVNYGTRQPEILGQNYPGKRNVPDPMGPRTFARHLTRPVSSMPSVISSGSPTGPTKGMHPALVARNPAKYSRKMSISDAGSGGEGEIELHRPTKPSLIEGIISKVPGLINFGIERARMTRESLRAIFRGGQ